MGKNVVVIGGGTGSYTVLRGLKKYPDLNITAIVSMADDVVVQGNCVMNMVSSHLEIFEDALLRYLKIGK